MGLVFDRLITVSSVIENLSDAGLPEGEPETTKLSVAGLLIAEDGKTSIRYTEKTENGNVFSTIVLEGENVTVQRRGAVSFDMHFGVADDAGVYRVEPYAFDFKLHTLKIRNRMEKSAGSIDIFYLLNIGGADKKVRFSLTAEENRYGS